jgi:hypothetical protein
MIAGSSPNDIPEAMDRGIQDCRNGKKRSQNPYTHGSLEAKLWLEGWIKLDSFHELFIQEAEPECSC